jgi:hypothetical protein
MADTHLLRRLWTFLWKATALILALVAGLFLAILQSCAMEAIWPSGLRSLLTAAVVIAGIATTAAVVVIVARKLWRKSR